MQPGRRSCARTPTTHWPTVPTRANARAIRAAWQTNTRTLVRLLDQPRGWRHRRRHGGNGAPRPRIVRRRDDHDRRCPRLSARARAASRVRRARRRRRLPWRRHGRPRVPARRPLARNRRRRFRQRRLLAAARLQRRQLCRQPRRRGERRIPLADRATAARSSAPGRCSCIPCTRRSSPTRATPGPAPSTGMRSSRRRARNSPRISSPDSSRRSRVSAGAAWGHDGSHRVDDGVTAYFRVGKAF